MGLFGTKRDADPMQGSATQKPSPFSNLSNNQSSLFSAAPQAQAQSPSIFNNLSSTATNQPTPLFGNSSTTTQPSTLFGNTGSTTTTQPSTLFGNTLSTTTPQASTLFGNTPSNSNSSIFGSSSTNQPNQSNTLFGFNNNNNNNNTNNNNNNNNGATPSLFGSQANSVQSKPASGNLFGSNNQSNLFGASTQNTGSSLFGSQPTSNLLGNTATSSTNQATTLFGSTQQPAPNSNNPFGITQSQNNNNSSLNLFGSTSQATPSFFNSTNATTTPSNLFGTSTNNSLFNSTNQSILNRSSAPPTSNNNSTNFRSSTAQLYRRPITLSEPSIQDRIVKIHASWNVSDPQCQFQHFFYNLVSSDQVHLYGRPNHIAQDDPRWIRAKRNNPDPTRMVPTLAIGFEDLTKRVDVQQKHARLHLSKLEEISNRLNEVARKHNLETTSRLHKLKTTQVKLSGRLIGLVNKLSGISHHSSIPNLAGTSYPSTHAAPNGFQNHSHSQLLSIREHNNMSREEEEIISRMKNLKTILVQLGGKAKIAELWSAINQIKNYGGFFISNNNTNHNQLGSNSTKSNTNHNNSLNSLSAGSNLPGNLQFAPQNGLFVSLAFNDGGPAKWSITDEKELKKVLEILLSQQKGIDHLVLVLRKCRAEVSLMRQAFNLESNLKSIEW